MSDTDPKTLTGEVNQVSEVTKNTKGETDPQSQEPEKTYTQADVDRMIEARLGRQKKSMSKNLDSQLQDSIAQWREENGLTDEALEKFQSMDMTAHEIRTAKSETTKAQKARELAEARSASLETALRQERVDKALYAAAAGKANNPGEIALLLKSKVSVDPEAGFEAFVIGDDGESTGQTIEELVTDYLKNNPHHLKPVPGSGSGTSTAVSKGTSPISSAPTSRTARLEILRKGGVI